MVALFQGKKSRVDQQGLAMYLLNEEPQNLCGQCFEGIVPVRLEN
jgi:hypothetical protein